MNNLSAPIFEERRYMRDGIEAWCDVRCYEVSLHEISEYSAALLTVVKVSAKAAQRDNAKSRVFTECRPLGDDHPVRTAVEIADAWFYRYVEDARSLLEVKP